MQYCKSCGRELKEGVRFCERCGKSVRQGKDNENVKKQEQIEKLQKDRLERKRRQEYRENIEQKRKERAKKKYAKYNKVVIGVIAVILILLVTSLLSYKMFEPDKEASWVKPEMAQMTDATALPTMQPSTTIAPIDEVGDGSSDSLGNITNKDDYLVLELQNGMKIPYPEVFEKDEVTGEQKLYATDKFGGDATMIVSYEEYPGGTSSGLMKEYASDVTGEVTYSLAGNNWYGITVDDDGKITHRKYIIDLENDVVVYYDFEYDGDSEFADDYAAYIEYIDKKFNY